MRYFLDFIGLYSKFSKHGFIRKVRILIWQSFETGLTGGIIIG